MSFLEYKRSERNARRRRVLQAPAARAALAEIKAHDALAVFDEFVALLPGGNAEPTKEARQRQLDALPLQHGDGMRGRHVATDAARLPGSAADPERHPGGPLPDSQGPSW